MHCNTLWREMNLRLKTDTHWFLSAVFEDPSPDTGSEEHLPSCVCLYECASLLLVNTEIYYWSNCILFCSYSHLCPPLSFFPSFLLSLSLSTACRGSTGNTAIASKITSPGNLYVNIFLCVCKTIFKWPFCLSFLAKLIYLSSYLRDLLLRVTIPNLWLWYVILTTAENR